MQIKHHVCDSARWNSFKFRDDDVVIGTWSKTGTTWMQQIVAQLIFAGAADIVGRQLSPWLDMSGVPLPAVIAQLDLRHRNIDGSSKLIYQ